MENENLKKSTQKEMGKKSKLTKNVLVLFITIIVLLIALFLLFHFLSRSEIQALEAENQKQTEVYRKLPQKSEDRLAYIKKLENRQSHLAANANQDEKTTDDEIAKLVKEKTGLADEAQKDNKTVEKVAEKKVENNVPKKENNVIAKENAIENAASTEKESRKEDEKENETTVKTEPVLIFQSNKEIEKPQENGPQLVLQKLSTKMVEKRNSEKESTKVAVAPKVETRFLFQCGSFKGETAAERMRDKLNLLGFNASVETFGSWYRVITEPFLTGKELNHARTVLKNNAEISCILRKKA